MFQLGQNAKYSLRADVFRFAPDNRHAVTARHDRYVPILLQKSVEGFREQ